MIRTTEAMKRHVRLLLAQNRTRDKSMKCNQLSTAFLILGLPALTFASAQQPGSPPKQDPSPRAATSDEVAYYATVSKLIGANVWSRADAGGDRDDLADIKDFIVDAETGKVEFAILSSGGVGSVGDSLRRVSFSDLRFEHKTDGDECKVMLDLGEAEFERIAKVEEESLEPYRAKTVAASFRDRQAAAREASGDKGTAGAREAQMRATGAILASELDDFDVRAAITTYDAEGKAVQADKLGSIDEAWINTETGNLDYLTFEHKDRTLVFPLRALATHVDADGKGLYFIAPPADRLATAPAFDEAKKWDLKNAEFRQNIDRFYAMKDGAGKKVDGARREAGGSGK
jgi:hypothetical protein